MVVTCTSTLLANARARDDIKDQNLRILEALHEDGNRLTAAELAERVGRSSSAVYRSVAALLEQGLVAQQPEERPRKRPVIYYSMVDPVESLMLGRVPLPNYLSPVEQLILTEAENRAIDPEELVARALTLYLNNDRSGDPAAGDDLVAAA